VGESHLRLAFLITFCAMTKSNARPARSKRRKNKNSQFRVNILWAIRVAPRLPRLVTTCPYPVIRTGIMMGIEVTSINKNQQC